MKGILGLNTPQKAKEAFFKIVELLGLTCNCKLWQSTSSHSPGMDAAAHKEYQDFLWEINKML